jgi:O-antigen ligase
VQTNPAQSDPAPAGAKRGKSFSDGAESTARWSAILLGASIPISVALDNALLLVVLLAWLASGHYREKLSSIRANPVASMALVFIFLLLAGCTYGSGNWQDAVHFLRKYSSLLYLPVLVTLFANERDKRNALIAFGAAMFVTLVLSYGLWLGLLPPAWVKNHTADNPVVFKLHITHGIFMALASFLAVVAAVYVTDRRWRIVLIIAAALAAFNVLFMVQGRTGYLVMGTLAAYFFFARFRWRGLAVVIFIAAAVVAAGVVTDSPFVSRIALMFSEMHQWKAGSGGNTSIGIRMDFYRICWALIQDHPIFGVGTGGFIQAYADKVAGTGLVAWNNPHNQFLLTTVQLGVVGLLVLLALFATLWSAADKQPKPVQLAARALVLTMLVGSLFNSLLIDHAEGLLFAWMAGVLYARDSRQMTANNGK